MGASFGVVSRKIVELDWLTRDQKILALQTWSERLSGATESLRFHADDLDRLARGEVQPSLLAPAVDSADLMQRWAPWAVTFNAIQAEYVVHIHSDALCTIANLQDADAVVGELFGDITWRPYTIPGHSLTDALTDQADRWALVQGLGLVGWGDALDGIQARASRLEAAAHAWITDRLPDAGQTPEMAEQEATHLIGTMRGLLSRQHRVVLSIDPTTRDLAGRPDLEHLVREAQAVESTWPWAMHAIVVRDTAEATAMLGPSVAKPNAQREEDRAKSSDVPSINVIAIPGVGLVSVGRDQADADALGAVAAHAHRVAAAIIDGFGRSRPAPGLVTVGDDAVPGRENLGRDRPFAGRVFIVTGAASGIGRDIARHLAALGGSLSLADLNGEALEQTADELAERGSRPLTVIGDLTDELVATRLVDATVLKFGGIDGVVFNAGVALPGEIKDLSAADWRRSLEVNATSSFLLAKTVLPVLEGQAIGGSLVFIGSKNMFSPGAGFGAYSASKGALAQLARIVAIEAGRFGVRSNIVNPDNVFEGSHLWSPELRAQRAAVYHIAPEKLEDFYTQRNLLKVAISGLDVAKAVAFLLSDDAIRTTACVVTVDGGVPGVFPR